MEWARDSFRPVAILYVYVQANARAETRRREGGQSLAILERSALNNP